MVSKTDRAGYTGRKNSTLFTAARKVSMMTAAASPTRSPRAKRSAIEILAGLGNASPADSPGRPSSSTHNGSDRVEKVPGAGFRGARHGTMSDNADDVPLFGANTTRQMLATIGLSEAHEDDEYVGLW